MTATTARLHVVSEGVVASYIHDISSRGARRPAPARSSEERRRARPPARTGRVERVLRKC
jgi:hypothetical protein